MAQNGVGLVHNGFSAKVCVSLGSKMTTVTKLLVLDLKGSSYLR